MAGPEHGGRQIPAHQNLVLMLDGFVSNGIAAQRCSATVALGRAVSESFAGELTGSRQIVIEAAILRPIF